MPPILVQIYLPILLILVSLMAGLFFNNNALSKFEERSEKRSAELLERLSTEMKAIEARSTAEMRAIEARTSHRFDKLEADMGRFFGVVSKLEERVDALSQR